MISPQRYAREIPQRYRIEATKCKKCGKLFFPPRLICSACKSREFDKVKLSANGEIITYTVIHTPPSQFKDISPYAVGIVKLDDGINITAQIVDQKPETIKIGQRVKLEFRRIQKDGDAGVLFYGYKCVPVN